MKTHAFHFPHSRTFAAAFAVSALLMAVMASSAMALTPSDLAITSTAPSGATYGDKIAYTVTTTSSSAGTLTLSIDSGSSSVCKLTGGVVSVTGAGTCKIKADQTADATYDVGSVSQSFSVAKAPLTVTAQNASSIYGFDLPAINPTYAGFVAGDSASKLKTKPACSTTAIPLSPAGSYTTSCKGAASDNYSFTYVDGTFRQVLAPLVVIPTATVKAGKTPKFRLEGFGWQGWDDNDGNDLTGKVKCNVPKSAKRKAGLYRVSCSIGSLKSGDYAITVAPGLLTVKKR